MWIDTAFPFISLDDGSKKKLTRFENDLEFQNTFYNLLNIALYSFSVKGLPKTCNERFFKLNLILHGKAALINDKELGFLTLGCTPMMAGNLNIYGEWPEINAYGWNGFNKIYSCYMYGAENYDADALICRDNDLMYPLVRYIILYAKRLTDTMRTLDITARKLKTPYFITCDESQKTSVKKILDDIDFNKDSIIANRSTSPNEFNVLQTGVQPESVRVLWEHFSNLGCEIKTLLGINNATNLGKKERLVVDEAEANDILTDINLDYRLKNYDIFCETAKKMFGLDIEFVSNISIVEKNAENKGDDFYSDGSSNNNNIGGQSDEK